MLYSTLYSSPAGVITLECDDEGNALTGLWIEGQRKPGDEPEDCERRDDIRLFISVKQWLDSYFNRENPSVRDIPLSPRGNEFRRTVWDVLRKIPYGTVTTYGAVAREVAALLHKDKMSAQAVGGAVGSNPVSIIIPCHRVIGANGRLTGYAGGQDKKIILLRTEGIDCRGDMVYTYTQ